MSERCDWIVTLESTPGPYAQYKGDVNVWADEDAQEDELFRLAVRKLKQGAFYDRGSLGFWKLIEVKKG